MAPLSVVRSPARIFAHHCQLERLDSPSAERTALTTRYIPVDKVYRSLEPAITRDLPTVDRNDISQQMDQSHGPRWQLSLQLVQ